MFFFTCLTYGCPLKKVPFEGTTEKNDFLGENVSLITRESMASAHLTNVTSHMQLQLAAVPSLISAASKHKFLIIKENFNRI